MASAQPKTFPGMIVPLCGVVQGKIHPCSSSPVSIAVSKSTSTSFQFSRVGINRSQWHSVTRPGPSAQPTPAPASSADSSDYSEPEYTHEEAIKLRKERDSAMEELGEVSKKFGIAELEWEDERNQYLGAITGKIDCIQNFFCMFLLIS